MFRCLVIGATGLIGNHVARELIARGHEVTGLSRGLTPEKNLEGLPLRRVKADLDDENSLTDVCRGMDWVVHAAGYYPRNAFHRDRHVAAALRQTRNVIAAVLAAGVKRLVYTSSLTTIGHAPPGRMADERDAYDLLGRDPHPYFLVKHLTEEEMRRATSERGLDVVIVNPTGCFGPYEPKPPSLCLIPMIANGRLPGYVAAPINVVDVADVARGHVLAAERGRSGERYLLGGTNSTSGEVMAEIAAAIGVNPPRRRFPMGPALVGAYAAEALSLVTGRPPPFPLLGLRFLQYGRHISIAKAEKELGYRPGPMRSCYELAFAWFKAIGYCR